MFEMVNLPDLTKPNHQNLGTDLNALIKVEATPLHTVPSFESSSGYNFPLLPESQMDFPLFPECHHDLVPEPLVDPNFIDMFEQKKCAEYVWSHQELGSTMLPTLGGEGNRQSTSSNCFFKDFPTDIFEYFEHNPISSEQ